MDKMKISKKRIIAMILTTAIMASLFVALPAAGASANSFGTPQTLVNSAAISSQSDSSIIRLSTATPNALTLTPLPEAGGTITANPANPGPGVTVTLTATPASGFTFLRWETLPANAVIFSAPNNPQTTFVMTNAETVAVRAVFQAGSGRNLVVNVGPASGTGVAGGRAGAGLNAAAAQAAANAAAQNSGGAPLENAPSTANIQAVAATGHTFSRWVSVGGGGTIANPALAATTFTMPTTGTGAVTVRADFGPTRTVTVERNNNNWGTATANETSTAQHRRINLTATAASGFSFVHWEVAGSPPTGFTNASITNRTSATDAHFTMPNANVTVRAVFQSGTQSVTITTNNIAGGSANASATNVAQGTSIVVTAGQTVTISSTPPSGHALANWEVIGSPPSGFSNSSLTNRFDPSTTFTMPTGSVQIRANFAAGNRVAVQSNNTSLGTAVPNTGAATNGTTVTVTATPTSGNRFVRWEAITPSTVTFANSENATTTFTMPNSATTVRAVFETGTQSIPAGGGVTVNYTISGGNVNLQLPTAKVNEIINATSAGAAATLNMSGLPEAISATFPREAFTQLANANRGLELRFPAGTINLNRDAVSSVAASAGTANITVLLNSVVQGSLNQAQRDATTFNDRIFRVSITSAGQPISSFSGTIGVTVTYNGTLPVAAWRLTDAGVLEGITANHNSSARTVTFFPSRLSLFVVGQERGATTTPTPPTVVPGTNPFNDVRQGDWFFNNVMFVYNNGLMGGTSVNPPLFSPNMSLNRAMIVTILHRREGTPASSGVNPFSDVPSGQWFTQAIIWAAENNIVAGYGGRFNPNDNITRQDLAVILMRYADFKGTSLPNVSTYQGFNDSNRISDYAVSAVRRSVEAGIITGRPGNLFAPRDNCSRAEAAAMLNRFFAS